MNIGSFELLVLALSAVLLLIIMAGSFRLKVPRKVSLQGIEDPKAAEAYDRISRLPQFGLIRRSFVKKLKRYVVEGSITDVGLWIIWFGQNVVLRVIGADALRKVNEPTGSLLACYTDKEVRDMMSKTGFKEYKIEGKLGWIYIWGKKAQLVTKVHLIITIPRHNG